MQRLLRHLLTTLSILYIAPLHLIHGHQLQFLSKPVILLSLLSLASTSCASAATQQETQQLTPGKLRSLGENALMERDYPTAISYYLKAIEIEPDNAVNYYKLYNVHKRQRMLMEALEDISNAVRVELLASTSNGNSSGEKKKLLEYQEQKAKLLVGLGRCEEAVEEYKSMGWDGTDKGAEKAAICAKAILQANASLSKQDWNGAVSFLKAAISHLSTPSDAPDLLYQLAQSQFHTRDYYGCISDTGRLLKVYPQHLEAYALRGEAYWRLNEVEMAGKHFREGLKLDPEHAGECFVFRLMKVNILLIIV